MISIAVPGPDHAAFVGDNCTLVMQDPRSGNLFVTLNHGHFGIKVQRSTDRAETWQETPAPQYPPMPEGYFDDDVVEALDALRTHALADRREEVLAEFPTALAAGTVTNAWRSTAESLYRNWLLYICGEKKQKLRAG